MKGWAVALSVVVTAGAAQADADRDAFVASNVITTLYHELGHALVHLLELPVLGREEDAADALATLLVHHLHDEDRAAQLISDTALGYAYAMAQTDGAAPEYWGVHSLDGQRLAMMVCHFYGAAPEGRFDLAVELGMPPEMADTCAWEYESVSMGWGTTLDDLAVTPGRGGGLVMQPMGHDPGLEALLEAEVARINAVFLLPEEVRVTVEPCGEANAFYVLDDRHILMCTEFPAWFAQAWDADTDAIEGVEAPKD